MNLLSIIDHYTFGDSYLEIASKCAPFSTMIWYRIKIDDVSEIVTRATALRSLLKNSVLILSGRADIAEICRFNGVHLNSSSLPAFVVRKIYPELVIGYSAHSTDQCFDKYCDYFTLSPIFKTKKDYEVKPLGAIKSPAENVYALGGINDTNFRELQNLGYKGIAGISICKTASLLIQINNYDITK